MNRFVYSFAVALAVALAVFAPLAHAATFVVPPDATLVDDSQAIVSGVVISAEPRYDAAGQIETVFTIQIEEVLKGAVAGSRVALVEWGGRIGDDAMIASGAARYEVGKSYLVFLTADRNGAWTTQHFTLGRFEKKGERYVRDVAEVHGWDIHGKTAIEIDRHASAFRDFIRQRVAGLEPTAAYFVSEPPAANAVIEPHFADYDFEDASDIGAASWRNDSGSDVEYSIGGDTTDTVVNLDSGNDKIIEEDPNDVIPGTWTGSGVVAQARWRTAGSHPFDNGTLGTIIGSNVITQKGIKTSAIGQNKFRTAMVHELGHTLGFRHSNENCTTAVPCTSSAVMNSSVGSFNGALQQWDVNAVRAVYGTEGGASNYVTGRRLNTSIQFKLAKEACVPPSIATQPQDKSVGVGVQTSLSVTVAGSGPFTYQWYFGESGDTTQPVTGATAATIPITPTSVGTGKYWVQVGHNCSSAKVNSNTATVTSTCSSPAITAHPNSVSITAGASTQLQVTATGAGLTYQWFKGEAGDTSNPVGTNSNKLTVSPSETTKYWVRVSGSCGSPANSNTATVTVTACAVLTLGAPTATPAGTNKFTLSVSATSAATPLTFEWFRGTNPGSGGEKIGSTQSVTVTVTTPASFWARVKNACNRTEVTPLIAVGCTLPSIATQPADQTINAGQTANLSIAFSAGATVKWYRGTIGDKTNEVGSAANVTVGPLSTTTQFWAEVSNGCGAVASQQVTVTVRELADLVPMLGGRFFVQVRYINQFDGGKEGKLLGRSMFSTPLSETAVFTFGDQNVVELLVRVSDARPFDDNIHIFLGGLSDVEFYVVVTDSLTGIIHEYHKPANQLVGVIDRSTFPASDSLGQSIDALMAQTAARHVKPNAESSTIRLLNNRFEVRMRYRNQFTVPAGEGYMNARSVASSPTTETAVFFFDENVGSAEWMVRFSDARPFVDRIDLFHGGLSDVEFTIEVHDTQTGLRKEYHKGPFSLAGEVDRDTYLP